LPSALNARRIPRSLYPHSHSQRRRRRSARAVWRATWCSRSWTWVPPSSRWAGARGGWPLA